MARMVTNQISAFVIAFKESNVAVKSNRLLMINTCTSFIIHYYTARLVGIKQFSLVQICRVKL